jgi:hypothetical protein
MDIISMATMIFDEWEVEGKVEGKVEGEGAGEGESKVEGNRNGNGNGEGVDEDKVRTVSAQKPNLIPRDADLAALLQTDNLWELSEHLEPEEQDWDATEDDNGHVGRTDKFRGAL